MRFTLTLLLAFCLLAGLNARALAVGCSDGSGCCEVMDPCCGELHDSPVSPGNHHDGDGCPGDHHHHACCSHGLQLGTDHPSVIRLGVAESSLLPFRHEGELPPDGPVLGSEKPPLI